MLKVLQHQVEESPITHRGKAHTELDVVMQACNPSALGTGREDQEFRAVLGYINPTNQQQRAPQEIQTRVLGSVTVPGWEMM